MRLESTCGRCACTYAQSLHGALVATGLAWFRLRGSRTASRARSSRLPPVGGG